MSTIVSTDARVAQSNITTSSSQVSASVENLVSGRKSDANVADFSVGSILNSKVGTLRTAILNAGQAKSLLETAKGALQAITGIINDQKQLAVKAADDSLSDNERSFLNQEFQRLAQQIDRISANTEFNGKRLIDGSISGNAGITTATSLSTDNQGLLSSTAYDLAGTVLSGDLVTSAAVYGENVITFTAGTNGGSTVTVTIDDEDAVSSAAQTITYSTATTAAGTAANFVAAASAATGSSSINFQAFKYVDNGDGTVTVRANQAGTIYDQYTFQIDTVDGSTASIGNDGNEQVLDTTERAFTVNQSTLTDGTAGTFSAIESYNVGTVAYQADLDITATAAAGVTITITDVNGTTEGVAAGETVTLNFTNDGTATITGTVEDVVDLSNGITTGLNAGGGGVSIGGTAGGSTAAGRLALLNELVFEIVTDGSDGLISVSGARKGTDVNDFLIAINAGGIAAATLGGTALAGSSSQLSEVTTSTDGANRTTATTDATRDKNLLGTPTNFSATFNEGVGNDRNSVTFYAEINGVTYTSDDVYLTNADTSGSGISQNGDRIGANTKILFTNPDADKDTNGNITDNAFYLSVGTSAITFADLTSSSEAQASANTIADAFQTQLAGTAITQERSLNLEQVSASTGDHRIKTAVGTILEGLEGFDTTGNDSSAYNVGDIRLITDGFSSTGTANSISSFNVDRLTDTITTSIDGVTYTAYLNSATAPTDGGVRAYGTDLLGSSNVGSYNSTTKILDLDDGTAGSNTAKLTFFSASTTDGRILEIDLGRVSTFTSQIDISTDDGEKGLENALNAVFNVSSNDSLSFQVGAVSTDAIGVSIGAADTTGLYKDDSGVQQTLNISTLAASQTASDVLDNALNSVISLIADVDAAISSFDSAIANNESSVKNADASRSVLLDTDYSKESTTFAEGRVKVDAAVAVLTQVNARIQNLLQLLQQ